MALSRLRLRLTRSFAVAFLIGFALLDGTGYWYVVITNRHEFRERLKDAAASARQSIREEQGILRVDTAVFRGIRQAMADYLPTRIAFVVYDSAGRTIASGGDTSVVRQLVPANAVPDVDDIAEVHLAHGVAIDFAADTVLGTQVVAAATTDVLHHRQLRFLERILLLSPLTLVLALAIGYYLSRSALAPIESLGRAIEGISADAPSGRLPVHESPDELDRLALRFNALLDRIGGLQQQSHHFLREVAHQIRTPLTLIVGEAELGLERERSNEEHVRVLRRVHTAARQMNHRVHDLLLLARLEAGERPPLRDGVELDTLALEVTDLFRARAQALGQHLALDEVISCEVRGDEDLLREALAELIENACRHGDPGPAVKISVRAEAGMVSLQVCNVGSPIAPLPAAPDDGTARSGLGLSIVRWIASVHGGELIIGHRQGENVVAVRLPVPRLTDVAIG